jgi:hypothetical protein
MNELELFIEALGRAAKLPHELKSHVDQVKALSRTSYDQSFLDLLDTQIESSSRGPEWTKLLQQRRDALLPYCNKTLLKGRLEIGKDAYWVKVDVETQAVVYWERYENWSERMKR